MCVFVPWDRRSWSTGWNHHFRVAKDYLKWWSSSSTFTNFIINMGSSLWDYPHFNFVLCLSEDPEGLSSVWAQVAYPSLDFSYATLFCQFLLQPFNPNSTAVRCGFRRNCYRAEHVIFTKGLDRLLSYFFLTKEAMNDGTVRYRTLTEPRMAVVNGKM